MAGSTGRRRPCHMAGHRIQRVNEQLKREISRIVVREVSDPRVDAVTVTRVDAAPDLTFARVYVQLLGDEADRDETMEGLRAANAYIRTLLGNRLEMRRVPELRFERDRRMEHAMRIQELLAEVGLGDEGDEADEGDEPDEADGGGADADGVEPEGAGDDGGAEDDDG